MTEQDPVARIVPRSSQAAQIQRAIEDQKDQARFQRRILYSIGFIVFSAVGATVGYQVIEGWSFLDSVYMVAITLTTVGFGEVHQLSFAGRILTLLLVVFGVSGALYGIAIIAEYLVEGHFAGSIQRRRLQRLISRLNGHYIVCGFGRMGLGIVNELLREGQTICVVDSDPERCAFAETLGLPVVQGDATEDASLIAAGISRSKGLVAALDSDSQNAFVTLSARSIAPNIKIVARAESDGSLEKLRQVGADFSVTPYDAGAQQMTYLLTKPLVAQVIAMLSDELHGEIVLRQVGVTQESPIDGRTVGDIEGEDDSLEVIALSRDGEDVRFMPGDDVTLHEGDQIVAIGAPADLDKIAGTGQTVPR